MSTFKRADPNKSENVKACFGHPELDSILQNNLLKGQIILLEEDHPSTIHLQMARYFIGSAYHVQCTSIVYDLDAERWRQLVPARVNKKPEQPQQQPQQQQQQQQNSIAWRYQEMKMQFKLTNINQAIPSLDLSKSVQDLDALLLKTHDLQPSLRELLASIIQAYQSSLRSSTDSHCKKLVIRSLLHPLSNIDTAQLPLFLHNLRIFARSSHLLTLLSIPSGCPQKDLFLKYADVGISLKEIFLNKLFGDFQGTLHIDKCGSFGSYNQIVLDMATWGIKVKAKGQGLEIEQLYETAVQEDDEETQNQQVCSSKPKGNALEF